MEKLSETPDYVKKIIKELHENPYLRIKDYDLRQRGIEPSQIRRWFKKYHHITFHAYQRMLRINTAYNCIKSGNTITNSALDSGYNSLSGFNEGFRTIFGEFSRKFPTEKRVHINNKPLRLEIQKQLEPSHLPMDITGLALLSPAIGLSDRMAV